MKINNMHFPFTNEEIKLKLSSILSHELHENEINGKLKRIYSCIDNTTLEGADNDSKVSKFCSDTLVAVDKSKGLSNVASVCVYPTFVALAKKCLQDTDIKVASVAGGFPSAQMPLALRLEDVRYAVNEGADEIDTVISRGWLLDGKYDDVYNELVAMRNICGNIKLKVILETGELQTIDNIYIASKIAIAAGADFIKTSTGKIAVGATKEAAFAMLTAIDEEMKSSGKKIGFKAAGGISTPMQALEYFRIAEYFLGTDNIDNKCFRIGASRLTKTLYEQLTR